METSKNNIGDIIKKHRNRKGITQEKLAELIGKNQQDINRYENNSAMPGRETWKAICKELDIPLIAYFPESTAAGEYINEAANQTYIDKPLKEMTDLVINQRELLEKIGFFEFLKSIPEMTDEDKKIYISSIKTVFKLIKRSNQNGT